MQLHELRIKHKLKRKKRVGRGGKRGTYSGRGLKGQKSRAGRRVQPLIRQIIKRYPKLRGYKFQAKMKYVVAVNIDILEKKFESGSVVSPQALLAKKIIRRIEGKVPRVKILGNGELKKALNIQNCQVSASAKEKIEKAGGKIAAR